MQDSRTLEQDDTGIEAWLTGKVAAYVRQPSEAILLDVPLADYGLDSVYAFTMIGDIEDHLGLRLDPTVMWDFPTVRALATELTRVQHETQLNA